MAFNPRREPITLFSQLKPYLVSPLTRLIHPPIVLCPICISPTEILTPPTPSPLRPAALPGIVLYCGHMACKPCFTTWHNSIRTPDNSPPASYHPSHTVAPPTVQCPVCRYSLSHLDGSYCRHTLYTPGICPASGVPMTLPEGGRVPAHCSECRLLIGRQMGEEVVRLRGAGVTDEDEMERGMMIAVPQSWNEEIPGVFPGVVDEEDPVGYIVGRARGQMSREEERKMVWAQPEGGEVSGKNWDETRGEYM